MREKFIPRCRGGTSRHEWTNVKVKRCQIAFTTLPIGKTGISLLRTRYIYMMTDVAIVGWLRKWVYLFIVDYIVVRIFRCSKAKVRRLLDQGH